MIEFRMLGGLDVRGEDGTPVSAALSRPKPLALLAYLTIARPRGFHSQDALMALFWPEADTERARASLRQAVHVLRRALGETTIQRRGRNELGLDASRMRCDVLAFERALADGCREDALAGYRGDLLPAYFVPDAPDAERWLETERARLRTLGVDAARALAESETDPRSAIRWTARWAELAPDDERPIRHGLQTARAAGEPAAGLALFDAFAARRAHADDPPPSAALRTLAGHLRSTAPPRADDDVPPPLRPEPEGVSRPGPAPATIVGAGAVEPGPVELAAVEPAGGDAAGVGLVPPPDQPDERIDAVPPEEPAVPEIPIGRPEPIPDAGSLGAPAPRPPARGWPRRRATRWMTAAVALVAIAGLVAGSAALRRVPAARVIDTDTPRPGDQRLVVLPFAVRGSASTAYLREAMVDLLSTKLDGVAGVTAIDPHTLFGPGGMATRSSPDDALDVATGATLATQLGASQFVLGSVVVAGGRLEVTATLYGVDGRRRATADAVGATEATLFTVADALARQLLDGIVRGPDVRLAHTATATTTSLTSLKAFLDGEQRLRDGQRDAAADAYDRALRTDSTFALAAYRLSTTAYTPAVVRAASEQARRYADRLPRAERLLVRGNSAADHGRADEAEGLYRAALVVAPDMSEALRRIGELRFHSGPWIGRPFSTAQDAFERELVVDPRDVNARVHLARIAASGGDHAAVDSFVNAALRLNPEPGVALELRALRATVLNGSAGVRAMLPQLRAVVGRPTTYEDDDAWLTTWRVATYAGDPAAGRLLASVLTESGVPPHLQLLGYSAAAHLEAARGRWGIAEAQLAAAATIDPLRAADVRANLAWLALLSFGTPGSGPDGGWVQRARDGLLGVHPAAGVAVVPPATASASPDVTGQLVDRLRAVRRPYLLGVLALAAGDTAGSARQLRALSATLPDPTDPSQAARTQAVLVRHLTHQLDARLHWARGDAGQALRLVEDGWPVAVPTDSRAIHGDTYTQAAERVFRGDLLRALGRDREALAWYDCATEEFGATVALAAPVHLRRAALLERLGDRGGAATAYARVATLWADADPALRPVARAAHTRALALAR